MGAIYEYEKNNYWRVNLRIPLQHKESLQAAAGGADMSVNQFIVSAALEKIGAVYTPKDLIAEKKREKKEREKQAGAGP